MIPKFRAWDGEKMCYPRFFEFGVCGVNGKPSIAFERRGGMVTTAYIMQCTGAKDTNDTDIYEGDIIRKEECSPDDMAFGYYGSIGTVKYDTNVMGFIVDGDGAFVDSSSMAHSFDRLEVIGNIYENPGMVK